MTPAAFITFEGGEGAGKSTQIRLLSQRLAAAGKQCFMTREPGGTPLAEQIRGLLVTGEPDAMAPATELLLMVAARSDHARLIRAALAREEVVISDRFADSSVVYQGYGRGLDVTWIHRLNHWATQGLTPDLTLLLDIDPLLGLARAGKRQDRENRFEQENHGFHQQVRQGFLHLAAREPDRFRVLDATLAPPLLAEQIWCEVTRVCSL